MENREAQSMLPTDSAERKTYPLYSGLLAYFPAALAAVANHSHKGNAQHHADKPLHWDRSKSGDESDAMLRHLLEGDYAGMAWRALALLQKDLEAKGAPIAPGARNAEPRYTLKLDVDGTIKSDPGAYYRGIEDLIGRWEGLSDVERDAIRAASPISGHVACQSGGVVDE